MSIETARRFNETDLVTHGGMLLKRLQEHYPHLNEKTIAGWLMSVYRNNEYLFIVTDKAIGLAMVCSEPLSPTPVVQEVFVFVKDDAKITDGASIYAEFKRWATSLGASQMYLETFTDVPRDSIQAAIGMKIDRRAYSAVRLKK